MVPTFFPQELSQSQCRSMSDRGLGEGLIGGGIWVRRRSKVSSASLPGPKDEDEKCDEKSGVRGCGCEFVGIGDDGEEGFDRESQPNGTREKTNRDENASDKFDGGNEGGGEAGSREAEARKEKRDAAEIVELAPAVLCELKTPIKSAEEQEGRLEDTSGADGRGMQPANLCREEFMC